jgi:uncharacterized membrane protein
MVLSTSDSRTRSIVKAISWRATGSIDTFVLSWLVTGSFIFAGSIASIEVVTKIILYYFHERVWATIPFGKGISEASNMTRDLAAETSTASERNISSV